MKINYSIFKRSGKQYKAPYCLRFRWTDLDGIVKTLSRYYRTKIEAKDARLGIENEIIESAGEIVVGKQMRFSALKAYAEKYIYQPVVIAEGRKIDGARSSNRSIALLRTLNEYFSDRLISTISEKDLRAYKVWRLKQGDRRGKAANLAPDKRKPVKLSSINRELATMRRLFTEAVKNNWIIKNPFDGSKVIDKDAEQPRSRTLTRDEEKRLLAACEPMPRTTEFEWGKRKQKVKAEYDTGNPYLKAVVLLALDAGMRKNEILSLNWDDINLQNSTVRVSATNTKTQKQRDVWLTDRVKSELICLPSYINTVKIFPFNDFKRSWASALRIAKISGVTFHDLRRTAITNWQLAGIPMGVASKVAGHSTMNITQKHYTSAENVEVLHDMVDRLNTSQNGSGV